MTWNECQKWEAQWHGDCVGTEFGERMKQTVYARRMGLRFEHDGKSPFSLDCEGKSILDIGGGPYSMLLFCKNVKGTVIDPCEYPQWVMDRYQFAGITVLQMPVEDLKVSPGCKGFDDAWIYNCAQHVIDPRVLIYNARMLSRIVRVFEWIECGTSDGHPHELTEASLNEWLGGEGKVEHLNDRERGLVGRCYYGVFKGDQ